MNKQAVQIQLATIIDQAGEHNQLNQQFEGIFNETEQGFQLSYAEANGDQVRFDFGDDLRLVRTGENAITLPFSLTDTQIGTIETPQGNFPISVETKILTMDLNSTTASGDVKLDYALMIGEAPAGDFKLALQFTPIVK